MLSTLVTALRIALTYVEWAGAQRVVVDWRVVQTRADLEAFAAALTAHFDPSLRRTGIAGAIDYAMRSIQTNAFNGWRRVIDISGDGPNNIGAPVTTARDAAVAQGIVINGLPLMTRMSDGDWGRFFHVEDLDAYYVGCVIGGPGAFAIAVRQWEDFAEAVRRKLVLEIAWSGAPQILKAQHRFLPDRDCLIGEKLWQQRNRMYDDF